MSQKILSFAYVMPSGHCHEDPGESTRNTLTLDRHFKGMGLFHKDTIGHSTKRAGQGPHALSHRGLPGSFAVFTRCNDFDINIIRIDDFMDDFNMIKRR